MGRWKDGPGGAYFDANDDGPDQVKPPVAPPVAGGAPGGIPIDGVGGPHPGGPPPNPWHGGFTGWGEKPSGWNEWQTPGQMPMQPGGSQPYPKFPGQHSLDPGMSPNFPGGWDSKPIGFPSTIGPGGGQPGQAGAPIPQGSGIWQSLINAIMKGQSGVSPAGGGPMPAGGGTLGGTLGGAFGGLRKF